MAIRAITFDFWRTLFSDPREPVERRQIRIDALCKVTGASPGAAHRALLTSETEFLQYHIREQRTLGPIDAVAIVSRELGVQIDDRDAHELAEIFGSAILHHPPVAIPGGLEAVLDATENLHEGLWPLVRELGVGEQLDRIERRGSLPAGR